MGTKFLSGLRSAVFVTLGITAINLASGRPAGNTPPAPPKLSETGLYDADGAIDPRNLPFVPQYPLWSDGAAKSRWVFLPEGTKIDVSDIDAWRFPTGTKFWKEFAWGGRRIETRMIWKVGDKDWVFATYTWSQDQTEALLVPERGILNVLETAPGKRHSIPAVEDCKACHESSPAVVLGFNALQLSDDRDPLAPHAESLQPDAMTLRMLIKADRLHPPRHDLALRPPRIRESDPAARAALGYLSANCGGCHNDRGPLAHLGLVLLHDVAQDGAKPGNALEPAHVSAVEAHGRYVLPGVSPESARVVARGAPERSSLLQRMRSRRPSSQMPPLGTAIADEEAVELVRRWIKGLPVAATVGSQPVGQ
jgi:hypothetical protein